MEIPYKLVIQFSDEEGKKRICYDLYLRKQELHVFEPQKLALRSKFCFESGKNSWGEKLLGNKKLEDKKTKVNSLVVLKEFNNLWCFVKDLVSSITG